MLVAVALFVAVAALRFVRDDPGNGVAMLFMLPVSLLALSHGRRAGVAAGVAATLLVLVWTQYQDVGLGPVGWLSRTVPLLLVGFLLGDASDRLRRASARRVEHEAAAVRHRQAVEVNDTLVQGMAAAKWKLEAGEVEAGLEILDDTLRTGQGLVSRLISDSGAGGRVMG